jgi:hypothetical protein
MLRAFLVDVSRGAKALAGFPLKKAALQHRRRVYTYARKCSNSEKRIVINSRAACSHVNEQFGQAVYLLGTLQLPLRS